MRNDVHSDQHIVPIPGVDISQYCVSSVYQFISYWFRLMAPSVRSGASVAGRSPLHQDYPSCPSVLMNLDRQTHTCPSAQRADFFFPTCFLFNFFLYFFHPFFRLLYSSFAPLNFFVLSPPTSVINGHTLVPDRAFLRNYEFPWHKIKLFRYYIDIN